MPIIPEHIWKDVPEDEVKTYSNEPKSEDEPVVGSGPFKLVEGAAGGSTYRFVRNDDYWGGTPKMAEVDMTIYKSQDALVQSLKAGDIDFAEGVDPLQVKALEGQSGITAQQGSSPGFSEFAFNTGSVDVDTGKPLGDPNPALFDPKFRFALTFAIDRQEIVDKADQGAGIPAGNIIPPAYKGYVFQPPSDDAYAYDPEKTKQLLDEAGYKVGSDGFRTMPDGDSDRQAAALRPVRLPDVGLQHRLPAGVAEGRRHRLEGHLVRELQADQHHPGRRVRHLRVGLVRRARPGLDAQLLHLRPARQLVGLVVLQPGVRQALPEQNAATDDAERQEIVQQMLQILYEDAPYLNTVYDTIGEAYRSDRWEGFVPQPNPGGILLFQYGHANYLNVAPAGTASGTPGQAQESDDAGSGQVMLIVLVIALAGAAVVGGWLFMRRRTADDRE